MKKTAKILLMIVGINSVFSCTDLTEEPYTFMAPENSYNSAEDLNAALMTVFSKFAGLFGANVEGYHMHIEILSEFGSPLATKGSTNNINTWTDVNNPSAPMVTNVFSGGYSIINSCNIVLGRGDGIEMDETLRNEYYGQARFMRGLTYFYLLRLYGGLPIPETFTSGLEGLRISRKSVDETYDYILTDLAWAEEVLPAKSSYATSDIWRPSKGAAQALMSKVLLHRASMQGRSDYFEMSRNYAQKVIESLDYQLEPDFRDLWFWYNENNKNGIESVFELQFDHVGYIWDSYGSNGNVVNNMHIYSGANLPADPNVGAVQYARYGPSLTAYHSYEDNDLRKQYTFLTEITLANTGQTLKWVDVDNSSGNGPLGWPCAVPGNVKYWDQSDVSYTQELPAPNVPIIRYAEVLLNFAEAENELNGPTAAAYDAINQVRRRANLDPLAGLNKSDFAAAIYRERGWEFIGEGQLLFDGIRTDRIGDEVEAEINYGRQRNLYLYDNNLRYKPRKGFLMKIPMADMNSNPDLEQNPDN